MTVLQVGISDLGNSFCTQLLYNDRGQLIGVKIDTSSNLLAKLLAGINWTVGSNFFYSNAFFDRRT